MRSKIVKSLLAEYKDEIIIISSPGLANALNFKRKASDMLRIQEADDEDEIDIQYVTIQSSKLFQRHFLWQKCVSNKYVSSTLLKLLKLTSS